MLQLNRSAKCLTPTGVLLAILIMALVSGCNETESTSSSYPGRPIKLIVPFAAGGGSDTFGRIIQNAIDENHLLPQRMVIINVPGAGGTIGSRRVKNARPDGYTLLLLHEGMLTARHSGSANYGAEAFVPIAGTGNATQVIAVSETSPYQSLQGLMDASAAEPDSIVFSANIGAPSHFAGLMLESQKPGARFRYTQTGGGAKRLAALQGGHVDVSAFSIAEYVQFRSSGMRALALLGPERHPELPNLATASEQGFDVISQNMQFWWAPLGTPADRIEIIAQALDAAMQTDKVRTQLAEMKISDVVLRGQALETEIRQRDRQIAAVAPASQVDLPDFALIALVGVVLTGALSCVQSLRRRRDGANDRAIPEASAKDPADGKRFVAIGLVTLIYVAVLQGGWISFVPATATYVMTIGGILASHRAASRGSGTAKTILILLSVAFMMSLVMHHLFTNVLVVDLP